MTFNFGIAKRSLISSKWFYDIWKLSEQCQRNGSRRIFSTAKMEEIKSQNEVSPANISPCYISQYDNTVNYSSSISPLELEIPSYYPFKYWMDNIDKIKQNILHRKVNADIDKVITLYRERTKIINQLNDLRNRRHKMAKEYHKNIQDGENMNENEVAEMKNFKNLLSDMENQYHFIQGELIKESSFIPNDTHSSSPIGDENSNRIIFQCSPPSKDFSFSSSSSSSSTTSSSSHFSPSSSSSTSLDHLSVGSRLDILDFNKIGKISGSGFFFWKNEGVLLEFALIQYALSKAISKGFTAIMTPDLIRPHLIDRCGFQPRGLTDRELPPVYRIQKIDQDEDPSLNENSSSTSSLPSGLALIGTSEIPLASYHANDRLEESSLPIKYVAFSHCFRPEAGKGGKELKGLYRVHQFSKVELFIICKPEQSEKMLSEIIELQKDIFLGLGFTIRGLDMASEELGASSFQKIDIESWMPGRNGWGEISSASNCTDYQSRRLNIRYYHNVNSGSEKSVTTKKLEFPHTLNGTALSIPRTVLTILENQVQPDGSVIIPSNLHPWMCNKTVLFPRTSRI